mmetsp:Transcript_1059/g.2987  ORF Transcript_1059/g.2987 Transcript_1059/m.2987 type:complete len:261 (-) Transcript_1059:1496-2278(-)
MFPDSSKQSCGPRTRGIPAIGVSDHSIGGGSIIISTCMRSSSSKTSFGGLASSTSANSPRRSSTILSGLRTAGGPCGTNAPIIASSPLATPCSSPRGFGCGFDLTAACARSSTSPNVPGVVGGKTDDGRLRSGFCLLGPRNCAASPSLSGFSEHHASSSSLKRCPSCFSICLYISWSASVSMHHKRLRPTAERGLLLSATPSTPGCVVPSPSTSPPTSGNTAETGAIGTAVGGESLKAGGGTRRAAVVASFAFASPQKKE